MKHCTMLVCAALGLGAMTLSAQAGTPEEHLEFVADLYDPYIDVVDGTQGGLTREQIAKYRKFKDCRKKVAAAQKKFAPDELIHHNAFWGLAVATQDAKGGWVVRVADLGWFCDEYERTLAGSLVDLEVSTTIQLQHVIDAQALDQYQLQGLSPSTMRWLKTGAPACERALAEAAKVFKPEDTIVLDRKKVPFGEVGNPCARYAAALPFYKAAWAAKSGPLYEVYRGVGMGGERLELFVENGPPDASPWLAPGCKGFVTSARKLAKAKKLFQWSEGDVGYQVTKYVFKGDTVTWSTAVYPTEKKAYKACR
jgi:hypothetical protein